MTVETQLIGTDGKPTTVDNEVAFVQIKEHIGSSTKVYVIKPEVLLEYLKSLDCS